MSISQLASAAALEVLSRRLLLVDSDDGDRDGPDAPDAPTPRRPHEWRRYYLVHVSCQKPFELALPAT